MTTRPILFSSDMVRAILAGRKTVTRRVIKPQPQPFDYPAIPGATAVNKGRKTYWFNCQENHPDHFVHTCQYGKSGDRLWVRESYTKDYFGIGHHAYRADGAIEWPEWRPGIFMPRSASRITLEITDVRFEKLQEITPKECDKEGIAYGDFIRLWDSLNSKGGFSWENNPYVWVIDFVRIDKA